MNSEESAMERLIVAVNALSQKVDNLSVRLDRFATDTDAAIGQNKKKLGSWNVRSRSSRDWFQSSRHGEMFKSTDSDF